MYTCKHVHIRERAQYTCLQITHTDLTYKYICMYVYILTHAHIHIAYEYIFIHKIAQYAICVVYMAAFLFPNESQRNCPKWSRNSGFLFCMISKNNLLLDPSVWQTSIWERRSALSLTWYGHEVRKWSSSSISFVLQNIHIRSFISSFGFWCRPVSTRKIWELVLNFAMERLYRDLH